MIDQYLDEIRRIQDDGGVLIIKWDGERTELRHTIVVTRNETDYVWRKDCDNIGSTLQEAIRDYNVAHSG